MSRTQQCLSLCLGLVFVSVSVGGPWTSVQADPASSSMFAAAYKGERMPKGHPPMGLAPHPKGFGKDLEKQLDLNKDQKQKFHEIQTQYRVTSIKKSAEVRAAEVELAALFSEETPNWDRINEKVREIGTMRTDLMLFRVASLHQLRELLTKEQYQKFREILLDRMEMMTGGHGSAGHM